MIFKDILPECDPGVLADLYCKYYDEDDVGLTEKCIRKLLSDLKELSPVKTEYCLIASRAYDLDGEGFTEVQMHRKEDIRAYIKEGLPSELPDIPIDKMDKDTLFKAYNILLKKRPESYAIDFTPWEEILGASVFKVNVDGTGVNEFVSYVIAEMTFNGWDIEEQEKRRTELLGRLEDALKEINEGSEPFRFDDEDYKDMTGETRRVSGDSLMKSAVKTMYELNSAIEKIKLSGEGKI